MPEPDRAARLLADLTRFFASSLDELLSRSEAADAAEAALALFREMAAEQPAYRRFLQEHGIDPAEIRVPADWARLPLTSKASYVNRFSLAERCRGGSLDALDVVAMSSGSTGEPTAWPRGIEDEIGVALRFEQVFHDSFEAHRKRSLAVICFALGTWVGGLYTLSCCRLLSAKGYPLVAVAPGNNKAEIWRALRRLAPEFEQIVLLGYPPFLKDVVDAGEAEGIDWSALDIKLVMAGEVFSEEWRDLVAARAGIAEPALASAALYGTADGGVLGVETPLSIVIRRFLARTPEAARQLFGESRLPTLVQYDPFHRFFEVQDRTLLFTGSSGVPLIRYHIADSGGLVGYAEMLDFLRDRGFDPVAELARLGRATPRALPFVYVFGRADFTVSFFGANIYPENVTVGLEQPGIAPWVTGKFVLQAREGLTEAPHLHIAVELAPGIAAEAGRQEAIARAIREQLLRLNSEFGAYVPAEFQMPRIALRPAGDPEWFPAGVKHRYTRR